MNRPISSLCHTVATTQRRPSAFTLIEVTAAVALLGAMLATFVPLALLLHTQRRASEAHHRALQAADNLLERVLALDWQHIQSDLPAETIRADELLDTVPGGKWKLAVVEESEPTAAKRVTVMLSYRSHGQPGAIRLTAWKHAGSRDVQANVEES